MSLAAAPADLPDGDDLVGVPTSSPKPMLDAPQNLAAAIAMWMFVIGPMLCLLIVVPFAWGWGVTPLDLGLAAVCYVVSGLGVTVGYHRCFTHRAFKAKRPLRIALAVAGSLAIEGSPVQWVANHRRHHAFSDREGDPHSPWRYGTNARALFKGLIHAHIGWMLRRQLSNRARFAPDIAEDKDLRLVGRLFGPLTAISLLGPAAIGWLVTDSWQGALGAFFWAGIMRMALLHHITLVGELRLPRGRQAPLHQPRPRHQLLAPGDHLLRRELAQLPPRRPHLRPPRRPPRPDRPLRPPHLDLRAPPLGPRRRTGPAWTG